MDKNTGNHNTGNHNTGSWNTGDNNTGDYNTGNCNAGDNNTGVYNAGDNNTGDSNTGDRNTGDRNTGDRNTGDRNTGYWNTGNCNTGNNNTGNNNTGVYNTGNYNTGYRNVGCYNTGSWNTGFWNTGDCNTGFFCTETPKQTFFDQPTGLTLEEAHELIPELDFKPLTKWVTTHQMTDQEKKDNPLHAITGGCLRINKTAKEQFKEIWPTLPQETKDRFLNLPNFNAEKFLKCTGVDVRPEPAQQPKKIVVIDGARYQLID